MAGDDNRVHLHKLVLFAVDIGDLWWQKIRRSVVNFQLTHFMEPRKLSWVSDESQESLCVFINFVFRTKRADVNGHFI